MKHTQIFATIGLFLLAIATASSISTTTPNSILDDPAWASSIGSRVTSYDGKYFAVTISRSYPDSTYPNGTLLFRCGKNCSVQFLRAFPGLSSPSWTRDGRLVMAGVVGQQQGLFITNKKRTSIASLLNGVRYDSIQQASINKQKKFIAQLRRDNIEAMFEESASGIDIDDAGSMLATYATPQQPSVSPSGTYVAFVMGGDLWTLELRTNALRCHTNNVLDVQAPYWSADSRWIGFRMVGTLEALAEMDIPYQRSTVMLEQPR